MADEIFSDYKQEFILALRKFRCARNISAREMSLALGQNVNYINLIESGKRLPSMQGFFSICEYFNVFPADFLRTCSSKLSEKDSVIQEISVDLYSLSESEISIVKKMVHSLV